MYFGYLGLLHFGLADGSFVRWAGRRAGVIRNEWRTVGRWLLAIQVVNLAIALVAARVLAQPVTSLYLIALAASALCVNSATLASFALQAAGDFKSAGRVAIIAPGLFVVSVLLVPAVSLAALLGLHVVSCAVAAAYAVTRVVRIAPARDVDAAPDAPALGALLTTGLPVLAANVSAGLTQSADRILLSIPTPITTFALYGFASTVAVATGAVTQALSRVALSHAARRPAAERARFLGAFLDVIAAGYGVVLLAEPLFEHLVRVNVPTYVAALPIVRAFTLGVPFWVATHVVLVGTLQSYGLFRRQVAVEVCGVALVLAACGIAMATHAPLWRIAAASSLAAVLTFTIGVCVVRRAMAAAGELRSIRFAGTAAVQGAALLLALASSDSWIQQSAVYLLLALVPTFYAASRAREQVW